MTDPENRPEKTPPAGRNSLPEGPSLGKLLEYLVGAAAGLDVPEVERLATTLQARLVALEKERAEIRMTAEHGGAEETGRGLAGMVWDAVFPLSGEHGPENCPTYYDGCNCSGSVNARALQEFVTTLKNGDWHQDQIGVVEVGPGILQCVLCNSGPTAAGSFGHRADCLSFDPWLTFRKESL